MLSSTYLIPPLSSLILKVVSGTISQRWLSKSLTGVNVHIVQSAAGSPSLRLWQKPTANQTVALKHIIMRGIQPDWIFLNVLGSLHIFGPSSF